MNASIVDVLSTLLVCSLFSQDVEAIKFLGYGAMLRDNNHGCSKLHPNTAKGKKLTNRKCSLQQNHSSRNLRDMCKS